MKADVKAEFFTVSALVARSPKEAKQHIDQANKLEPKMTEGLLFNALSPKNIKFSLKVGLLKLLTPIVTKLQRINYLVQMIDPGTAGDAELKEATEFYKSRGNNPAVDPEDRARCLELLGVILRQQKQAKEALAIYRQALQLRESVPNADVADKRDYAIHLAEDLIQVGNVKEGIKAAESMLKLPYEPNGNNKLLRAATHHLLAQEYFKLHDYKNSLANYDETLSLFHELNRPDPNKLIAKGRAACAELLDAQTKTPSK